MEFKIKQNQFGGNYHGLWYIACGNCQYLWKDLEIYNGTFEWGKHLLCDDAPGYYKTKAHAEATLRAYELLESAKRNELKFTIRQCRHWPERGWYIITDTGAKYHGEQFVWRDLELHKGTGLKLEHYKTGQAPGYYHCEAEAHMYLREFKEKHNMNDNLEINVKLNGVPTPLHEISEETLLVIREASKLKPVPVFQVCDSFDTQRLIFKVTKEIANCVGKYIAVDNDGKVRNQHVVNPATIENLPIYSNIRELKLDEV